MIRLLTCLILAFNFDSSSASLQYRSYSLYPCDGLACVFIESGFNDRRLYLLHFDNPYVAIHKTVGAQFSMKFFSHFIKSYCNESDECQNIDFRGEKGQYTLIDRVFGSTGSLKLPLVIIEKNNASYDGEVGFHLGENSEHPSYLIGLAISQGLDPLIELDFPGSKVTVGAFGKSTDPKCNYSHFAHTDLLGDGGLELVLAGHNRATVSLSSKIVILSSSLAEFVRQSQPNIYQFIKENGGKNGTALNPQTPQPELLFLHTAEGHPFTLNITSPCGVADRQLCLVVQIGEGDQTILGFPFIASRVLQVNFITRKLSFSNGGESCHFTISEAWNYWELTLYITQGLFVIFFFRFNWNYFKEL